MKFNSNIEEGTDKKEAFKIIGSIISEDAIILDYGCGNKELKKYLPKKHEYYGYNLYNIPFPKGNHFGLYFNFIICNQVIEHMNLEELELFFERCNKTLKEDGKIIIGTININEFYNLIDFWNDPSHIRPYTEESIRQMAEQYGFEIEKTIKYMERINPFKVLINKLHLMDNKTGIIVILRRET